MTAKLRAEKKATLKNKAKLMNDKRAKVKVSSIEVNSIYI
jgi:hypothetical protein